MTQPVGALVCQLLGPRDSASGALVGQLLGPPESALPAEQRGTLVHTAVPLGLLGGPHPETPTLFQRDSNPNNLKGPHETVPRVDAALPALGHRSKPLASARGQYTGRGRAAGVFEGRFCRAAGGGVGGGQGADKTVRPPGRTKEGITAIRSTRGACLQIRLDSGWGTFRRTLKVTRGQELCPGDPLLPRGPCRQNGDGDCPVWGDAFLECRDSCCCCLLVS